MLTYTVIIAICVFALAWVLNKTLFLKNPAKRWIAWVLTTAIFFVAEFALIVAKFAVYEQMSRELGVQVNPKNPLDLIGSIIMCVIFFSTLKKVPKKGKEKKTDDAVKSVEVQERIEPK